MKRESFGSRLGFILVSAGCAIGIGNVWKFPYICGAYGGAAFILIYLCFLVILGIPVLVSEFAVGRGSHVSVAKCFDRLAPEGTCWKPLKYIGIIGCYMLMMFYTTVGGWMLYYCYAMAAGKLAGKDSAQVTDYFTELQGSAGTMTLWMVIVVVLSFGVCSLGVQRGLEKITKVMMLSLLALIVVLAIHSLTLDGAMEGVKFYLVPDFASMKEIGIGNVIFGALSQAFFTLSIGGKDAEKALKAFTEVVAEELKKGEKIQLVGFGTFEVGERAAREGINPRTRETIKIAAAKNN